MVLKSHWLIYARVIILFKGKIFNLNAPIFYGNCHWTLLPCDGAHNCSTMKGGMMPAQGAV